MVSVKANDYVEAAHAIGASQPHILLRTILPNCLAPAVIMATLDEVAGGVIMLYEKGYLS